MGYSEYDRIRSKNEGYSEAEVLLQGWRASKMSTFDQLARVESLLKDWPDSKEYQAALSMIQYTLRQLRADMPVHHNED